MSDAGSGSAASGGGRTIPCMGCGYDISSLPVGGFCPECGRQIIPPGHEFRATGSNNGMAIAALVLGILSLVTGGCGLPFAIAAVICGNVALARVRRLEAPASGRSLAKAGLICGLIAIGLWLLAAVIFGVIALVGAINGGF